MTEQPASRERRPITFQWHKVKIDEAYFPPMPPGMVARSLWRRDRIIVLSSLSDMDLPDGAGIGPTWLISVSRTDAALGQQVRPRAQEVRTALNSFEMRGAEEDNHEPGVSRKFFMPVDPKHRVDCECKTTEAVVREGDGYVWTTPKDGSCRGCAWARMRRDLGYPDICPLHRVEPPNVSSILDATLRPRSK